MKYVLLFWMSLFLGGPAIAQPAKWLQEGQVDQKKFAETVEVEWIADYCVFNIPVGEVPMKFIFDTGASTIISKKAGQKLGLTTPQDSLVLYDINQAKSTIGIYQIPTLQIGQVGFHGFYSMVSDVAFFDYLGVDGLLGGHIFKDLILQVDRAKSTVIFTDQLQQLGLKPKDGTKFRATPYQELPLIKIHLDSCQKYRHEVLFDSGADGLYHISREELSQLSAWPLDWVTVSTSQNSGDIGLYGGSMDTTTHYMVQVPNLTVNKQCFPPMIAKTFQDNKSSIGARLFCYGKVALDFRRHRFFFLPYDGATKQACSEKEQQIGYGINFNFVNDHVEIISIWKGLPADQAGLKAGMVVTRIGELAFPQEGLLPSAMNALVHYDYKTLPELTLEVIDAEGKSRTVILKQP